MKIALSVLWVVGCGGARGTDPVPSNAAPAAAPAPISDVAGTFTRQLVEDEHHARHVIWLEREHAGVLDTRDHCCGISYDGNKYNDRITSCAATPDACPAGTTPVYPGIAPDTVCHGQRRSIAHVSTRPDRKSVV